jgi:hypothetical protein
MAKDSVDQVREAAEKSLSTFIKLVAPHRVLGGCHEEVIKWWTRKDAKNHQLVLLPRDHQKSALVAYRVAWEITKNPSITVLYISSTSNLAEKQLKFIKDILTSKKYRRYWPEMVHQDEGKRAKWSSTEIEVDHPTRIREGVRDPTVFTAGLTTSITGLHCNIAVLDDIVVQENAYISEGREKVKRQYSLLASIETTDAREWVVGTRYHPADLYGDMLGMQQELFDENGSLKERKPIYELYQKEVEDRGDGTGNYLWPRQQRADGKWYGFNQEILSTKKAQYLDKTQFRAQYYNDPNSSDNEAVSSDYFQYYERKYLEQRDGRWTFRGKPLNVFAAIDFAYSLQGTADYTALVVVGVDSTGAIYVLDVDRFKTNKITTYYEHLYAAYMKWGFRKLRAEVTVAQEAIVEELKDRIREYGLSFSVDKFRPVRTMGTKDERIHATLAPRYENMTIWHYKSGIIDELELELKQQRPQHDDIKDALANAVAIVIAPKDMKRELKTNVLPYNSRFGGVSI